MALINTTRDLFGQGNEVEIRLGRVVGGNFVSSLTFLTFAKIYTTLKGKYPESITYHHQFDYIKGNHRLSVFSRGEETLLKKHRRAKHDFQGKGLPFDVRASACQEEIFSVTADLRASATGNPDMVREKDRATFSLDGFHIDATVAKTHRHKEGRVQGDEEVPDVTYEIEIEIENKEATEEALSMLLLFLKWIGESSSGSSPGLHDFVKCSS